LKESFMWPLFCVVVKNEVGGMEWNVAKRSLLLTT